jgi:NDP-sugar pyrophosphorylase family protein
MKVLILAGGRGTRLKPYTTVIPKPLMPVGELPILEIILRQLKRAGASEVILGIGHMGHLFEAFFGRGERIGLPISYVLEEKPLGTAGAIANSIDRLGEHFLVMNGDLLTTLDYRGMFEAHLASKSAATIGLYRREVKIDFGVIETGAAGELARYVEKPVYAFDVSMGVNAFTASQIREHVSPGEYLDIPDLMMRLVKAGRTVGTHRKDCYWLDIGRVDDYHLATETFESRRAEFLPEDPLPEDTRA